MIVALLLPTIAYQITDYKIHEWLALQELLQREHVIYKMLIKQARDFRPCFCLFLLPNHNILWSCSIFALQTTIRHHYYTLNVARYR